jgi:propionyl-CoA carboxylase beta chain
MNKLTAYQRIQVLADNGTFEETGAPPENKKYNDNVIIGTAKINGRLVFIIAIDPDAVGGSIGQATAEKINHLLDMAVQYRAPVVALFESVGARVQEGITAMHHIGIMFRKFAEISGVVPTIAILFGINSGATAYCAGLMDFIIMVENASWSFITGPKVIEQVIGEKVSKEELGNSFIHGSVTGLAAFVEANEYLAIQRARILLSYLPQHCFESPGLFNAKKEKQKKYADLNNCIPADNNKKGYDMSRIIEEIVDDDSFLELHARFAPNLLVGFAKLGEATVGVVANQPLYLSGILDVDSCRKMFRFVQICDAYNIPILFIADSPGFMPGKEQEQSSMISLGARVLSIISNSTIPKVTLIVNKIIGGAYGGMSSRGLGADIVLAWPSAQISIFGTKAAMSVIYQKEIARAENKKDAEEAKIREFEEKHMSPYAAAQHGQLDAIIDPLHTRRILLKSFISIQHKVVTTVKKRRNILPM